MIVDHTEKITTLDARCLEPGCTFALQESWSGDQPETATPPTVSLLAHTHGAAAGHDVQVRHTVSHATTLVVVPDVARRAPVSAS